MYKRQGTLWVSQATARALLDAGKGGAMVNISSVLGSHPMERMAHYCASKAAVSQLTRVAAREWGPKGIRVNAVYPGLIETPLTSTPFWKPIRDRYVEGCALRRTGKPQGK